MAKKKKSKLPKFHYCETWKMNYHYFIGWSVKDFNKYILDNYNHPSPGERGNGLCMSIEIELNHIMLIWIRYPSDFPALAHECVHAANWTLQARGFKYDYDNDEPMTYLVEEIFKKAIGNEKNK